MSLPRITREACAHCKFDNEGRGDAEMSGTQLPSKLPMWGDQNYEALIFLIFALRKYLRTISFEKCCRTN